MVECGGLENRLSGVPGYEGSNPSSSASLFSQRALCGSFFFMDCKDSALSPYAFPTETVSRLGQVVTCRLSGIWSSVSHISAGKV